MNICTQIDPEQYNYKIAKDACYYGDPILYAFYDIPAYNRAPYIADLIRSGTWTWEQTSESIWLVTATDQEDYSYTFVVDSVYRTICWDQSSWTACQQ
jgi:hypothetical protein